MWLRSGRNEAIFFLEAWRRGLDGDHPGASRGGVAGRSLSWKLRACARVFTVGFSLPGHAPEGLARFAPGLALGGARGSAGRSVRRRPPWSRSCASASETPTTLYVITNDRDPSCSFVIWSAQALRTPVGFGRSATRLSGSGCTADAARFGGHSAYRCGHRRGDRGRRGHPHEGRSVRCPTGAGLGSRGATQDQAAIDVNRPTPFGSRLPQTHGEPRSGGGNTRNSDSPVLSARPEWNALRGGRGGLRP